MNSVAVQVLKQDDMLKVSPSSILISNRML